MQPKIALAIPGSSGVVPAPVVPYVEDLDTQAEPRAVGEDRHAAVLVIAVEIIGVDPAAISLPVDIAPGPIVHTAIQCYEGAGRYARHQRIVAAGACAKMNHPVRIGARGNGNRRRADRGEPYESSPAVLHPSVADAHHCREITMTRSL